MIIILAPATFILRFSGCPTYPNMTQLTGGVGWGGKMLGVFT